MDDLPEWFDKSKLKKIRFEKDETGWAIDIGNGQYRLVNDPLRGWDGDQNNPQWGDLVELVPNNGDDSWLKIIEKYRN